MIEIEVIERNVSAYAKKLKAALEDILPQGPNEATLRHRIEPILNEFCGAVGVKPQVRDEYIVAEGQIADAVFDRLLIEFKRPGVLPRTRLQAEATSQLVGYVEALAKREKRTRLAGVVFDGERLVFIRYLEGRIAVEPVVLVTQESLQKLLLWLAGLSSGPALNAKNLSRDFSLDQPRTKAAIAGLYSVLTKAILSDPDGMVGKLFSQWKLFFSEAINYKEAFGGRKLEPLKKWVAKIELTVDTPEEAERFFFALHTYFALLVKLIAWLALSRHLGPRVGAPIFHTLLNLSSDELQEKLRDMERGGIFRAFGIENLLEGDFFAWYLYGWSRELETAIRGLLDPLSEYDPTTMIINPDETRDLLKNSIITYFRGKCATTWESIIPRIGSPNVFSVRLIRISFPRGTRGFSAANSEACAGLIPPVAQGRSLLC